MTEQNSTYRVVYVEPGKPACEKQIGTRLEDLQAAVGGYIECVYAHDDQTLMLEDSGSANAHAPLQVVNTKGFDLPQTGDRGVWMYGLIGVVLMAGSLTSLYLTNRKKGRER